MVKAEYITPIELGEKVKTRISDARKSFEDGVRNPRRDPIQAAIDAINSGKWEKNFKAGIAKWVKNLSAVTLEDWKALSKASASFWAENAAGVGAERWGEWYTKAQPIIDGASKKMIGTNMTKEDWMAFFAEMQKTSGL